MDKELEKWFEQKKEYDLEVSCYGTDPYVDENQDIFDINLSDDPIMDDTIKFIFRVSESGVDET